MPLIEFDAGLFPGPQVPPSAVSVEFGSW